MLSLAKVGRGGLAYYLQTVAAGRSSRGGLVERDAAFVGRAAESLGICDLAVDAGTLRALADGVDPRTREVLDDRHGRVRVAGFDCTFAAPKSVSLLHALGPAQAVEEVRTAHERSVAAALSFLEDEAGRVRRRAGGVERVIRTDGLVAAAFPHRTSRAPDPHLHTHLFVANLGRDGAGRWSALDARPLFLHSRVAGALYRAELRAELTQRLDVAWSWREDGIADLVGVRPDVLRAFSQRSEAILAALERAGPGAAATPAARRAAASATRPAKDLETPYPALVERWRERAYDAGVSMGQIARVAPVRPPGSPAPPTTRRRDGPDIGGRPFTRRDLLRARSCRAQDGERVAEIVAAVDAELASGLASGAFAPDPDAGRRAPAMGGRAGARFPGGLFEPRFVTRGYLTAERELVEMLERAPEPAAGQFEPGLYALRLHAGAFGVARALAERASAAYAAHARVVVLAPSPRRAAHAEALLGVEVLASGARALPEERGALVIVLDAACWEPPSLRDAVAIAVSRGAVVVVAPGPRDAGRSALATVLGGPDAGVGAPLASIGPSPAAVHAQVVRAPSGAGAVAVSLVDRLDALLPTFLAECARMRTTAGAAIGVAGDSSVAGEIERAGRGETAVVTPSRLAHALALAPGAGIVVLGGARVLGRTLRRAGALPADVVHVAVAPATREPAARARWVERVTAGGPPAERPETRQRARDEIGRQTRFARGPEGIGR